MIAELNNSALDAARYVMMRVGFMVISGNGCVWGGT
jgi:hypothetical protein